tara:strand:+ start:1736 stop:4348 length:2613 start_codon:yes stop_codon:yes gene_type:complete
MFRTYTAAVAAIFALLAIVLLTSDEAQALDVDLQPINFTLSPEYPITGEGLEIRFEVVNNGLEPAENVKIIVWNSTSECDSDDECMPIFERTEAVIVGTEDNQTEKNVVVEFICNPDGPDGCGGTGDRVITVSIDYDDDISETNEDNNKIVHEFTIYSQPLANLKSLEGDFSIIVTPENAAVGDTVDILALFENAGRDDCSDFYIEFRYVLDGSTTIIETAQMRFIVGPGESAQYNISWVPEEVGEYTVQIFLDSEEQVDEFSEDDNIYEVTVNIREHTPELTLDESRNLTIVPNDWWLDLPYHNHAVTLVVHVLNEDYDKQAYDVRVGFYDYPENGTETLIGYAFIDNIVNATKRGEEIIAGTAEASIVWDSSTGTSDLGNHTLIVRIDPLNEIEEWTEDDNDFNFTTVVLEAKPDMTVFDEFDVPMINIEGEAVRGIPSNIVFTVFNKGAMDISDCPVEFRVDGELIESWELSLGEGEFFNLTGIYTWDSQEPSISIHADIGKVIDELDERNNAGSLLVKVAAPEYDLSLVSIDEGDPVFKGDHVEMVVQVRNNLAGIPSFRLGVYIDNSSSPEVQSYDFEGNPVYYIHQEDLLYEEIRFVTVFWKTTTAPGTFNVTILAEITNSDFEDQNLTDNSINATVIVKPKNYQLFVEMVDLPGQIYLNETLKITVSAINFGPEICCECPDYVTNMSVAMDECNGAEISLFIDGALFDIYQTVPLNQVNGEEIRVFYWQPDKPGNYYLEAVIDPDNIIDEYNELDNRAYAEVNVTVEEFVVVEPEPVVEDESFFSEPLIWAPLIALSMAGLGYLVYSRIGGDGDYLDYYEESDSAEKIGGTSQQSGFRYDPATGQTYDSQTGEVIESGRKKNN